VHRVFREFVEGVRESPDVESMRSVMAAAIAAFDLRRFTYFSPPQGRRGAAIFISTYPTSWTDHYFARRYEAIDPVFSIARTTGTPLRWGKDVATLGLSEPQKQLFDEAAGFGIRNGLTLPLAASGEAFSALTIVADEKPAKFNRIVDRNLRTLQLMAVTFHAAVRRKHWLTGAVDGVKLTVREIECLDWSARGKSAWETGSILGIAERTVEFHLDNARAKLGVRSRYQAIARLKGHGD
jgi:LuxR family transcriptional regulator, activator of conjugal transfer of Ti plasmids